MIEKSAGLSYDRKYRFWLSRVWKKSKGFALFVLLNPSTADENSDDQTTKKCIRYAESWGYGGMKIVNLFAFRARNPSELYVCDDPSGNASSGGETDYFITVLSRQANITVCGWGPNGSYYGRGEIVKQTMLTDPHYLKLTKDKHPWHPLYLKNDLRPIPWRKA